MLFWHKRQINGIIPPEIPSNIVVIVKIKDGFRLIYLCIVSMKVKVTLRNTFYRLYPSICTIFNIIFRSNKKKKSYDISYLKGTFSQGRVFDSYENIDIEINS